MKRSCIISILATPSLSPICYSVLTFNDDIHFCIVLLISLWDLWGGGLTRSPLPSLLQAQSPSQREAKVQRTGPDRLVAQLSLRGVVGGSIIYRDGSCKRHPLLPGLTGAAQLRAIPDRPNGGVYCSICGPLNS